MFMNVAYLNNSTSTVVDNTKPLIVTSCGNYRVKNRSEVVTHRPKGRKDYQLLYIASGKGHFFIHGEEKTVSAGNIIIYLPDQPQEYVYYREDQTDVYWVHFTGNEVEEILKYYNINLQNNILYIGTSPDYQWLFGQMIQELQLCRPRYDELISLQLRNIFVLISRAIMSAKKFSSTSEKEVAFAMHYTKDENGRLVIDPEQAEVVRRIYREYLDGYSTDKISAGLERDGILTGAGNPRWHTSTVAKILRNEKYMGDALLQKTYTVDYLSKKRIKNNGIMPQYYVENDHEAIIPKEIFMRVQDELVRRRLVKVSPNGRNHGFSSNHVFSQMIVCGECSELFRRVHWNNHGCRSIVWRCVSRLQPADVICHARTVNEEVLKNVVVQAFNEMLGSRSTYRKRLRDNLAAVIRGYADDEALEIDKRLAELQQELINHASRREDYNDIADEIFRIREMKQKNFTDTAVRDEQVKRINELNEFIEQQDSELTEFDESLARRWLKEIVVWDERFSVELKSGVIVNIVV